MYRIKKIKNRITNKVKYQLQQRSFWIWCDMIWEINFCYSKPVLTDTLEECESIKRKCEEDDAWE